MRGGGVFSLLTLVPPARYVYILHNVINLLILTYTFYHNFLAISILCFQQYTLIIIQLLYLNIILQVYNII